MNLPPKKLLQEMLADVLNEHVAHPDFGSQIRELRNHVIARQADKAFYACMIRKFAPDHDILKISYIPPSKPRKAQDS